MKKVRKVERTNLRSMAQRSFDVDLKRPIREGVVVLVSWRHQFTRSVQMKL